MDIPMKCPICGKRAFDASGFQEAPQPVEIALKCPRCGQLVRVPIVEAMRLPMSKGGGKPRSMTR